MTRGVVARILLGALVLFIGAAWLLLSRLPAAAAPKPVSRTTIIRAELRSWVVAGRGRHLYLDLMPAAAGSKGERIEFTSAMLRRDYRYTLDKTGAPRVARMRGGPLRPPEFAGPPDNRLEQVYEVTADQAACLARDRAYSQPYVLLGANSNAALRRVMEQCGCMLPAHVLAGGGWLGEFPGIDADVGEELPLQSWGDAGIDGAPARD